LEDRDTAVKALKTLLTFLFLALLINVPLQAVPSTLQVTVYADKPSYYIEEKILVYGKVTMDGVPIENELVALEVHDPAESTIVTRTLETNVSGIYSAKFQLPSEASAGTYTVYVSCSHNEARAENTTSFELKLKALALTVKTTKESYMVGETIIIHGNVTFEGLPLQGVLIALEVRDPNQSPMVMRVVETEADGSYELHFNMPNDSKKGNYTVHATASYETFKATEDKNFVYGGSVIPGDVDGDGDVDIYDVVIILAAYGSRPGDPNWDPRADITEPYNKIDLYDAVLAMSHYGEGVRKT